MTAHYRGRKPGLFRLRGMSSERLHPFVSPAGRAPPSPSGSHHVSQPPTLLTTALGAARSQSSAFLTPSQQPQSATSLSAPFSPYQHSAYSPTPSAVSREASPMATRTQASFNGSYNPQQWGPLSNPASSPLEVATRAHQPNRPSRFPRFAPRQTGPDGTLLGPHEITHSLT